MTETQATGNLSNVDLVQTGAIMSPPHVELREYIRNELAPGFQRYRDDPGSGTDGEQPPSGSLVEVTAALNVLDGIVQAAQNAGPGWEQSVARGIGQLPELVSQLRTTAQGRPWAAFLGDHVVVLTDLQAAVADAGRRTATWIEYATAAKEFVFRWRSEWDTYVSTAKAATRSPRVRGTLDGYVAETSAPFDELAERLSQTLAELDPDDAGSDATFATASLVHVYLWETAVNIAAITGQVTTWQDSVARSEVAEADQLQQWFHGLRQLVAAAFEARAVISETLHKSPAPADVVAECDQQRFDDGFSRLGDVFAQVDAFSRPAAAAVGGAGRAASASDSATLAGRPPEDEDDPALPAVRRVLDLVDASWPSRIPAVLTAARAMLATPKIASGSEWFEGEDNGAWQTFVDQVEPALQATSQQWDALRHDAAQSTDDAEVVTGAQDLIDHLYAMAFTIAKSAVPKLCNAMGATVHIVFFQGKDSTDPAWRIARRVTNEWRDTVKSAEALMTAVNIVLAEVQGILTVNGSVELAPEWHESVAKAWSSVPAPARTKADKAQTRRINAAALKNAKPGTSVVYSIHVFDDGATVRIGTDHPGPLQWLPVQVTGLLTMGGKAARSLRARLRDPFNLGELVVLDCPPRYKDIDLHRVMRTELHAVSRKRVDFR